MDIHWRNAKNRSDSFSLMRGRLSGFCFFWSMHGCGLILAVTLLVVFWIFERKGLMFSAAVRAMRCWFVGRWRPTNKRTAMRRMVDYGNV